MADTRGIEQDELHQKSIATQIEENIDTITAVLVLANGTVPCATYAFSTLSTSLPKALAGKIAFVFTHVSSPLYQNLSEDTIPEALKGAPKFLLDNSVPLQRKYLKHKYDPKIRNRRTEMREMLKSSEEEALEMLVNLFDWLDSLERQPTTKPVPLGEASRDVMPKITGPSPSE